MLILSRKLDESIVIRTSDGDVTLMVTRMLDGRVLLGFDAPDKVKVWRTELLPRVEKNESGGSCDSLGRKTPLRVRDPHNPNRNGCKETTHPDE